MRWLEVSVQADGEAAEAVSKVFNRYCRGGAVVCIDCSLGLATVKAYLPLDDGERRRRLEEALWHLSQIYPIPVPQFRELAEGDWAAAWKEHYPLMRIGRHIVIKPPWLEHAPKSGEVLIELDPGMAFGTGLHPTTRMCLVELEGRLKAGMRVLDLGTGSGILAIAAAKLGAAKVLALDIDPIAVESAQRNVIANGVEGIVSVRCGSLEVLGLRSGVGGPRSEAQGHLTLDSGPRTFDLMTVNILAEVIVALIREGLSAYLERNGLIIAGGIIETKETEVVAALEEAGLAITGRRQEKDWVTLVGKRDASLLCTP